MAISVTFGKTTDPVNCANKTYTSIKTISGVAIEPEQILNPSFLVNFDAKLLECNYCEITDWATPQGESFNRFYFCKVTTENGGNIRINCTTDPLRTFWDEYKTQPMTIVRSTSFGAPTYVQDGMLPIDAERTSLPQVIYFSSIHETSGAVDCYDVVNTI